MASNLLVDRIIDGCVDGCTDLSDIGAAGA
jgi:hypothetical protein